jgi:hypothetical protein
MEYDRRLSRCHARDERGCWAGEEGCAEVLVMIVSVRRYLMVVRLLMEEITMGFGIRNRVSTLLLVRSLLIQLFVF